MFGWIFSLFQQLVSLAFMVTVIVLLWMVVVNTTPAASSTADVTEARQRILSLPGGYRIALSKRP
jgi:hypothetical protein